MLISLHIAKAAGTSFRHALHAQYGERLFADYRDRPFNTPVALRQAKARRYHHWQSRWDYYRFKRQGIAAIHGHFLIYKYSRWYGRPGMHFVTWLREPIDRLESQYDHWLRTYQPQEALPLQRRVVEEDWDLERFLLAPELRDMYAQYLYRFPLGRFDFVGISEDFSTEMRYFSERFWQKESPLIPAVNRSPRDYEKAGPALRARAQDFHREDYVLYQQALALRKRR